MSGLKPPEIELRLWHITEELARLRARYVLGNMNDADYKGSKDKLHEEYLDLKNNTEDADPDFSEPDYTDYVSEEGE